MVGAAWRLLFAYALIGNVTGYLQRVSEHANPIRKVVKMLQDMQQKVTEEGEADENLYNKFMCYCKTNGNDLADSIAHAETKVPELGTEIEESEAKKAQLDEDVAKAQKDRASAKTSMLDATAVREKEAAAFASEKNDLDTNIAAIRKAVAALEAGSYAAFVQTDAGAVLQKMLSSKQQIFDSVRPEMLSFLSGAVDGGYAPQSGEVIGILKELDDQMSADLSEEIAAEGKAVQEYEALMVAKKKEIAVLTASIESKMQRSAELGISIVHLKDDLSDTEASLLEDKKFSEDLKSNCANKTAEWDEITKIRSEELVALAETIKILNDDAALDLFKQTLPSASASFLQLSEAGAKRRALSIVHTASNGTNHNVPLLNFISLALSGKKIGFEKVIEMIDEMVGVLKKEQVDDDGKKEYCNFQLDSTDDKLKGLERSLGDVETAIAATQESLDVVTEEIAALNQSIMELDKSTVEATEMRRGEHTAFTEMMQESSAAKELLGMAKNRLHKFYNPALHVTTPAPKVSREDQIYNAFQGPGFTQLRQRQLRQADSFSVAPPPPEAPGPYEKQVEQNSGVLAMLDLLIKDLDTQMTEAKADEVHAQETYTELMHDSAAKRVTDSKSMTEKTLAKADMNKELLAHTDAKASTTKDMHATSEYLAQLHSECDWLLRYYGARKEARSSEINSLGDAKAVLKGADYSMLQLVSRGKLRLSSPKHLA